MDYRRTQNTRRNFLFTLVTYRRRRLFEDEPGRLGGAFLLETQHKPINYILKNKKIIWIIAVHSEVAWVKRNPGKYDIFQDSWVTLRFTQATL